MDDISSGEFIPQAIISKPISYFENRLEVKFQKKRDDLDEFDGAAFQIDERLQFALKHYPGYPPETTTIYLPDQITKLEDVTEAIGNVIAELRIEPSSIIWQRKDNPDL